MVLVIAFSTFVPFSIRDSYGLNGQQYSWPMFHHDVGHTGYSGSSAPDSNNLLWRFKTNGEIVSSPVVDYGLVYVGSRDHFLYSLNATTGDEVWKYETRSQVESTPSVVDARVYVGSNDNYVYCFDAYNGSVIWRFETQGPILSLAVFDGKVYASSADTYVYCLDGTSGAKIWRYAAGGWAGSITAVNGKVFVGSWVPGYNFSCLNAITGTVMWSFQPRINIIPTYAAVADDKVFIGEQSIPGYMYSIDANTGELIWDRQLELPVASSPAVGGGKVFVGSNDNYVYCFDAADGSLIWRFQTQGPVLSSPAVADGEVLFGSNDGFVYAIDESSGTLKWSYGIEKFVRSSPAIADDQVFVGSDDGYLYAFGPRQKTFVSLEVLLALGIVITVVPLVMILWLIKSRKKKVK